MRLTFINRRRELQALQRAWERPQADLFVVYGRRRVGKTELLREFFRGKPHVYFQGAHSAGGDNLRQFQREAGEALDDAALLRGGFADWESALEHLAQKASHDRLAVVIDEFPYLCEANPALPSLIQRFWDQHGLTSRLFLVLCGSSVSFMVGEVLSQRSPLFGRRTGQLELRPLDYRHAAQFLPGYHPADLVRAFGSLGGMPMYQSQFDPRMSFAANVQSSILQSDAFLYDEPEYLLRSELHDPGTYNSLLEAIASGLTKHNEIAQRAGKLSNTASPYLATLERLGLVQRVSSVTERSPGKRTVGRYFLCDHFLRFWYRFVMPNRSLLEIGEPERVWKQRIVPYLDDYLGLTFEDLCRQYVRLYAGERLGVIPDGEVGRFWSRDVEIDILCRNDDGSHTCGECKWSTRLVGESMLTDLQVKAQSLPAPWQERLRYVLFSRSGFTESLQRRALQGECTLIDLKELYATDAR